MIYKLKKSNVLLWLIVLCVALKGGEAFAANEGINVSNLISAAPGVQWVNTDSVEINLSFDRDKAICGACVTGKTNTTKITGTVVLARKNSDGTYTSVKKWENLAATGNELFFDKTYYVTTGYTYRLIITSTVYLNGSGETVSAFYEAYAS